MAALISFSSRSRTNPFRFIGSVLWVMGDRRASVRLFANTEATVPVFPTNSLHTRGKSSGQGATARHARIRPVFDLRQALPYTRTVHRVMATLLGLALVAGSTPVSALHIHDYTDHDHPDHHHGLAAHEHHAAESDTAESGVQLENCDPGQHAISFVFVCSAPQQAHAIDAEVVSPAATAPELPRHQAFAITDVRVHGPPPFPQTSPRGPPSNTPA